MAGKDTGGGMDSDERHVYGPRPVGALMPRLTRVAFRRRAPATAQVLADWSAIVGPAIAAVTTPRRLAAGTLTIACAGPIAMELQHLAAEVIARINAHLGSQAVSALRFVQTPELSAPLPALPRPARSGEARGSRRCPGRAARRRVARSAGLTGPRDAHIPQPLEVLMTLTRRSTLTVAGGAAAVGVAGYLGCASSPGATPMHWRSRRGNGGCTGGDQRKSERSLGDPAAKVTVARVLLTDLHPLRRLRPRHDARSGEGPDRAGQGAVRLSRLPAGPGGADRRDGRAQSAAGAVLSVRQRAVRQPRTAGPSPAVSTRTEEIWKLAALAGMSRATFDQAVADTTCRSWILQQQQADQDRWKIDSTPSFVINGQKYCRRDELRRVPQAAAGSVAGQLARPLASLLDLGVQMAILRTALLSIALAPPAFAAPEDSVRGERSMGSPQARRDLDRVLLAHLPALRRLRPRVRCRNSRPSGSHRASCAGCSTTSPPTSRRCRPPW